MGVDLGVDRLAVTSTGEVIPNPRYLRSKARKLARAQRVLSRKARGSADREKARCRVAVAHRKVRAPRLDAHHKLAVRLVRDNQAVYVEDLSVVGLVRTRLAKSVYDWCAGGGCQCRPARITGAVGGSRYRGRHDRPSR